MPRAEAVVEIAGLRLDDVPRRAAARAGGIAMKIIELRPARRDPHLVDEGDGVGQREMQPAAVAAAEQPAAATAAAAPEPVGRRPPPPDAAPAPSGGGPPALAVPRCAARAARTEAELRAHLVDHRLRRSPRFQRLGEVEAEPQRVLARAVEIDRPQVDADQLPGSHCATKRSGNAASIAGVTVMLPIGRSIVWWT